MQNNSGYEVTFFPQIDEQIIEQVSERDRLWFARHPRRSTYIRRFVNGELPYAPSHGIAAIIVFQVIPGFRLRKPICLAKMPSNSEAVAYSLLRRAMHDDDFNKFVAIGNASNKQRWETIL